MIENKKILVTGGAGFIGSGLCEELLKTGNKVRVLDNFSTGYKHNIAEFCNNPNFELIEGDIRDFETCKKASENIDYVFHQAALGSVPRSINDPVTSTDVNIGGIVKMLKSSVENKVKRFIYASSSSVYGDSENMPKTEHIIGHPLSPYAVTKYVCEVFAQNFSRVYGIETVGLRYFNVFGRRQDPKGDYAAVIPKFVSILIEKKSPVINGDGTYSRDFTYIDNVIQANILAAIAPREKLLKDNSVCPVFNVAHGERTDLNELFHILVSNLSELCDPKISEIKAEYVENRKGDIPHSWANIEKTKELLGYKPAFDVRSGLKEACKWYVKNLK